MAEATAPKRKRRFWIILLVLCLLLLIAAVTVYLIRNPWWVEELDPTDYHRQTTAPQTEPPTSEVSTVEPSTLETASDRTDTVTTEPLFPDNPVDFASLAEVNPDIYAWIYIPMGDKTIDLPVLQSSPDMDDNYYLHHSVNKEYLFSGSIYTQRQNAKDFSDRVTVIYGHNMKNGTKFSNLVYFTKKQVFDEYDVFYIYTPGHILTYKIAAAIEFDKRHILNNFDFSQDKVYEDWIQNYILHPKVMVRAVRSGVEVTTDDKLVILSTCLVHNVSWYLIQGVLISDEPTN